MLNCSDTLTVWNLWQFNNVSNLKLFPFFLQQTATSDTFFYADESNLKMFIQALFVVSIQGNIACKISRVDFPFFIAKNFNPFL